MERQLNLSDDEQRAVDAGPRPPFKVTRHWLKLMKEYDVSSMSPDHQNLENPLRIQAFPSTAEMGTDNYELADPLGESDHSPLPRLVRRYDDRALVVVTGKCALYCRHCFRRRLTGEDYGDISRSETDDIADWLTEHNEVKELLLSGGDPLTLDDRKIIALIDRFRAVRPDLVLRLATRMPIVEPKRITRKLAIALGRRRPIWIVIQSNHPAELSEETLRAIDRMQKKGLPVINQAVLLKGVNDNVDILEALSRRLVSAGIKPYYLFQGDVAAGTGHFRLPLESAREIAEELRGRLSGLAMPNFAVDLPGGGGKVPLGRDYVSGKTAAGWKLRTPDGKEGFYPDPEGQEQ